MNKENNINSNIVEGLVVEQKGFELPADLVKEGVDLIATVLVPF